MSDEKANLENVKQIVLDSLIKLFAKDIAFNKEATEQNYTEYVYTHRKDHTKTIEDCKCTAIVHPDNTITIQVPEWFVREIIPLPEYVIIDIKT